jgi:hypothetical protein
MLLHYVKADKKLKNVQNYQNNSTVYLTKLFCAGGHDGGGGSDGGVKDGDGGRDGGGKGGGRGGDGGGECGDGGGGRGGQGILFNDSFAKSYKWCILGNSSCHPSNMSSIDSIRLYKVPLRIEL